jgi:CHAT domain-containing protein
MARRLNLVNPHQRRKLDEFTLHELMRNRKLKVLFLDASASGNVELIDETGGTIVPLQRLDELSNTEKEKEVLETFARTTASTLMEMPDVIDGRAMRATDLIDRMRDKLINGGFDIFHYSGHSISLGKGGTFLIFPDGPNRARAISVRAVADWVSKGSCRLVVLSSCRGASLRTAIEVMKAGAEAVLGFRWDVDDGACVDYFRSFYAAYLGEGRSFSSAYCEACREVQTLAHGTPIWASAVAVVRD